MADLRHARCPRCKAIVLVADARGLRYAVDIAPADAIAFGRAIGQGIDLLWVVASPGGGVKLSGGYGGPRSPKQPSWAPGGAQGGSDKLHAEHSCGAPARDMVLLSVQRPPSAPATPGSHRGGPRQPDAPGAAHAAPEPRSPARPATRRPSERAIRCSTCNRLIDRRTEPYVGIEYETYRWANHDGGCP